MENSDRGDKIILVIKSLKTHSLIRLFQNFWFFYKMFFFCKNLQCQYFSTNNLSI